MSSENTEAGNRAPIALKMGLSPTNLDACSANGARALCEDWNGKWEREKVMGVNKKAREISERI